MGTVLEWVGNIVILIGLIFMALGIIGIFRYKDLFGRVLVGAKIDTVAFITVLAGIMIKHGADFFSWKTLLVIALFLVTNPLGTHAIVRSAHLSGYRIKKER